MDELNFNNRDEIIAYIQALQEKSSKLEKENDELKVKNSEQETIIEKQNQQISNLTEWFLKSRKKMFGKSSEQLKYVDGSEQLSLFNEAEKEYDAAAPEPTVETITVKTHERKNPRKKEEIYADLEHKEFVYEDENPVCNVCGASVERVGKEFVRSEICIIPEQIFILDVYRAIYKCPECEDDGDRDYKPHFVKADVPPRVIKKSLASASIIAYIMQQKYMLGMPLFRIEQYWKSKGIEANRTNFANWIIRGSLWFKPLFERMLELLLAEDIIHADETEVRVLKRDGQQVDGVSREWVFCSGQHSEHKMSLYVYRPTRSGKVVEEILGNYGGYLQTDGYSAYNKAEKSTHIGCWAHAKRKWNECLPKGITDKNSKAAQALELIERLFAEDKGLEGLPIKEIHNKRLEFLKPVLDDYWQLLESIDAAGGSNLEKARNYSLGHRKELENFLLDGRLELTNNRAERAVKPFVIGRKNWLFSDTDKGAEASSMCYSIIESAKLNGLDVYAYLMHLLTELPKLGVFPDKQSLDELMPWSDILPDFCR